MNNPASKSPNDSLNKSTASFQSLTSQAYDPHHTPASLELAMLHAKASRVYKHHKKEIELHGPKSHIICPCCGHSSERDLLPLDCDVMDLSHLGSGYVLYFVYYKYCIALLCLMLAVFGIYSLWSNFTGNLKYVQKSGLETFYSQSSFGHSFDGNQFVLLVLLMVAMAKSFPYLRMKSHEIHKKIMKHRYSISDYSIMIRNIPPQEVELLKESGLKKHIKNIYPEGEIMKVVYAFDLKELDELKEELGKTLKISDKVDESLRESNSREIEEIKTKIHHVKDKNKRNLGIAYITFNTTEQAEEFFLLCKPIKYPRITNCLRTIFFCCKKEHDSISEDLLLFRTKIKVTLAPEPHDIEWKNLRMTDQQSQQRKFKVSVISFLLGLACAISIFCVQYLDKILTETEEVCEYFSDDDETHVETNMTEGQDILNWFIDQLATLILIGFDSLQEHLCMRLAKHEGNKHKTEYAKSLAVRVANLTFYSSAFSGFTAILIAKTTLDNPCAPTYADILFGKDGVIDLMSDVFVFEGIKNLCIELLDYRYQKKLLLRDEIKQKQGDGFNQEEANEAFEGTEAELELKIGTLTSSMMMVSLYTPLFPLSIVITLFYTVLNYWIDKYKLLRRNARPFYIGPEIEYKMINLLKTMIFWMWIGGFLVLPAVLDNDDDNDEYGFIFLCLGFATLNIIGEFILPDFVGLWIKHSVHSRVKTYDEVKGKFEADYEAMNPFTRDVILKNKLSPMTSYLD